MLFEWDEAKNLENIRKHKIGFADVPQMFDGSMLIELDDRFDYGEDRQIDMNDKNLKSTSHTNWEALESMSDDDIDYSDIPPLTDEFFNKAILRIPVATAKNLVQLDPDVMAWFEAQGGEYKATINSILRRYIQNDGDEKTA